MTKEPFNQSKELSRALGHALEQIYAQTPYKKFDELVKLYNKVKDSFLPKVVENEFLTLEIKRRVSELILYSAIEKHCSFDLCHRLFNDLHQLKFTNLEKKASIYLIYSRYCLQIGSDDESIRLLELLEAELEDELRQTNLPVYRDLLETTYEVLDQLRKSGESQ